MIKNPEADPLARQPAAATGEQRRRLVGDELADMAAEFARLPVLDPRTPDEILGYDKEDPPA